MSVLSNRARAVFVNLHGWLAFIFGIGITVMCWGGTVAVFMTEIEQWERPAHRIGYAGPPTQLNTAVEAVVAGTKAEIDNVTITPGSERNPVVRVSARPAPPRQTAGEGQQARAPAPPRGGPQRFFDPYTGAELASQPTGAASSLYILHQRLLSIPNGRMIVGVFALAMFILTVTGPLMHGRLWKEILDWRDLPSRRRFWLGAHVLAGGVAWPFLFVITFTGLWLAMPLNHWGPLQAVFGGDRQPFTQQMNAVRPVAPEIEWHPRGAMEPAVNVQPQAMYDAVRRDFPDFFVVSFTWEHPNSTGGRYNFSGYDEDRLTHFRLMRVFDANTGQFIAERNSDTSAGRYAYNANRTLHYGFFAGLGSQIPYFILGLLITTLVPTGMVLWLMKQAAAAKDRNPAVANFLVRLSFVASTGIVVASTALFAANKLLPMDMADRVGLERGVFLWAWLISTLPALFPLSLRKLARLHLAVLAAGFLALPVLNAAVTGQHPVAAFSAGLPAVALFDLSCLVFAALAGVGYRMAPADIITVPEPDAAIPAQAPVV